jgi:hypothetical protein
VEVVSLIQRSLIIMLPVQRQIKVLILVLIFENNPLTFQFLNVCPLKVLEIWIPPAICRKEKGPWFKTCKHTRPPMAMVMAMDSHQDIVHYQMMAASWVSRRKPHTGMGCLMGTSPFIKFPP